MEKIEIIMRRASKDSISETVLASFDVAHPSVLNQDKNILNFPGLSIHLNEHNVYRDRRLVLLTHREFAVLIYLVQHPKWVFSAKQIYSAVWHKEDGDHGTAVSNIVGQLRRKLNPDGPREGYIRTIVGAGYKFEIPYYKRVPPDD